MANKRNTLEAFGVNSIIVLQAGLLLPVFLLGTGSMATAQHPDSVHVEDRLGGIRVGDRLRDVKRAYRGLHLPPNRVWSVGIGRNCELEVTTSDEGGEDARVEVIALERTNLADKATDKQCDDTRTGSELRFGDGINEVRRIYKGIALVSTGDQYTLYRADSGADCLNGHSSLLRSMFIYWSTADNRIIRIIVEASQRSCREYRNTESEPK